MRTTSPSFEPRFCPNRLCTFHGIDSVAWPWQRYGFFRRKAGPTRIQRFRCRACARLFSSQTFDTTYYLKKPRIQRPLFSALVSCTALRQAARSFGVAPSTIQRQASRLGRHALLFEWKDGRREPREDLVLDGLTTFEYSQYWPADINLLVGASSHYVYGFTFSQLRRSGRMTAAQKRRRAELEQLLGRPSPRAIEDAVFDLMVHFVDGTELSLRSDQHGAYPRAIRRSGRSVRHLRVSSRLRRDARNPLFAINLLEMLIRHSSADHKRETIAFAKRIQGALERLAVLVVWRNHVKRTSERNSRSRTPAEIVGRSRARLTPPQVLARRLFPSRVDLPEPLWPVYWRRVPTRQLPDGTTHDLERAA